MKNIRTFVIVIFTLVTTLVIVVCNTTTPKATFATTVTAKPATTKTTNWWDEFGEPQYGGKIIRHVNSFAVDLDPYSTLFGVVLYNMEPLWHQDWTVKRDVAGGFKTTYTPDEYWSGNLAESWEISDAQTIIVHLRQGILWQDKAPVNGREFTSDDVKQHYDRLLGQGVYTVPSPFQAARMSLIDSVTAPDKYTVVFKFKYPSAHAFATILEPAAQNYIEAPEWVALGSSPQAKGSNPLADWHNTVGTGPWMLTDVVSGSQITFTRNPNYWGTDERYPQNKLPYADSLVLAIIPDITTAYAALRTGKIDYLSRVAWQQAQILSQTNPELVQYSNPLAGEGVDIRVDKAPFTDLRVRKALDLAIDRPTIAESYFGGTVDGTTAGLYCAELNAVGWGLAYEDWPQSLKDEYSYNPVKAKQLLAEAGFPNGFKTSMVASTAADQGLMLIVKNYLSDIGVDYDIEMMDPVTFNSFIRAHKTEQLLWCSVASRTGGSAPPTFMPLGYVGGDPANAGNVDDPNFNTLFYELKQATTMDDAKDLFKRLDQYALENHFSLRTFPTVNFVITSPSLKGFSGENYFLNGWIWARLWKN